eukprot:scaffold41001_cov214-Amphora_coffeaeformis.AAC.2
MVALYRLSRLTLSATASINPQLLALRGTAFDRVLIANHCGPMHYDIISSTAANLECLRISVTKYEMAQRIGTGAN